MVQYRQWMLSFSRFTLCKEISEGISCPSGTDGCKHSPWHLSSMSVLCLSVSETGVPSICISPFWLFSDCVKLYYNDNTTVNTFVSVSVKWILDPSPFVNSTALFHLCSSGPIPSSLHHYLTQSLFPFSYASPIFRSLEMKKKVERSTEMLVLYLRSLDTKLKKDVTLVMDHISWTSSFFRQLVADRHDYRFRSNSGVKGKEVTVQLWNG